MRQEDVYLRTKRGRLKIRRSSNGQHQLVFYLRRNVAAIKKSSIWLLRTSEPETLLLVLRKVLPPTAEVRKVRKVYYYKGVRIHLDNVVGLGDFIELEAAIPPCGLKKHRKQHAVNELMKLCKISRDSLLPTSYGDMVQQQSQQGTP